MGRREGATNKNALRLHLQGEAWPEERLTYLTFKPLKFLWIALELPVLVLKEGWSHT
jgi:hypothetical protein